MSEVLFYFIYQGIWNLFLSLIPIFALAWGLGFCFSLLARYLQIQDSSFVQAPKTLGLICALWILLPWEIGIWKVFLQLCLKSFFGGALLWSF